MKGCIFCYSDTVFRSFCISKKSGIPLILKTGIRVITKFSMHCVSVKMA